jgi:predicted SnoaL-like aldol condensation-catalyzing enzyme
MSLTGTKFAGHSILKRDYEAAERYWSPNYIQHSAHIPPGRDGLFHLIKSVPSTLRYESGTVVSEGDLSSFARPILGPRLALELDRGGHSSNKDGILVEHWDVIQDEATRESSKSGLPMFGEKFGG